MNADRIRKTFLDMIDIESPSWHEAKMAAYCTEWLRARGFEVTFDQSQEKTGSDTPQIMACLPGTAPGRIALSCHMDTVKPCVGVKPQVSDDRITSDGTTILGADDKAGIAQAFEAIDCVLESGVARPEIWVLLSVCEEQGVAGAPHYPDVLFDQETLCLVLDAAGTAGTIVLSAPYHYTFKATFHGVAAHAGVEPEAGINAIALASAAVCAMPLGRHDEATTSSIGVIEGGKATNIVADECVLRGECRSIFGDGCERVKDQMDEAMRTCAQQGGGSVDVDWELSYPGILIDAEDPDVVLLRDVAEGLGLEVKLASSGGGSDANVLGAKGCKAIPLGTGMTDFHSLHEYIMLDDLYNVARFVEGAIVAVGRRG